MRVLPLACLLLLVPAPPLSEFPSRTLPDTRSIGWVLIDSASITEVTRYALEQKALGKEAARCLTGTLALATLPDSVLVVHTIPALNVMADEQFTSFNCPEGDSIIGSLHTHIYQAADEPCKLSILPQHAAPQPRKRDDYQDLLFDDKELISYVMCDNGWVTWELKDGRTHTWRWRTF